MRYRKIGNFVATYDPNAKDKKRIRALLEGYRTVDEYCYPRISFLFHMPIPKSIKKRDVVAYNSGTLKHDKKPDVDNLAKLAVDCLDGIVIHGDQKVSLGPCIKVYQPEPKTIIWIRDTNSRLEDWEWDTDEPEMVTPEQSKGWLREQGYLTPD